MCPLGVRLGSLQELGFRDRSRCFLEAPRGQGRWRELLGHTCPSGFRTSHLQVTVAAHARDRGAAASSGSHGGLVPCLSGLTADLGQLWSSLSSLLPVPWMGGRASFVPGVIPCRNHGVGHMPVPAVASFPVGAGPALCSPPGRFRKLQVLCAGGGAQVPPRPSAQRGHRGSCVCVRVHVHARVHWTENNALRSFRGSFCPEGLC